VKLAGLGGPRSLFPVGAALEIMMTPAEKRAALLALASSYTPGLVEDHVRRLDADYFTEFPLEEMRLHLDRIASLTPQDPFAVDLSPLGPAACVLTVIGDDLPGFFAALSGVLASYDFDIKSGKVFTYHPLAPGEKPRKGGRNLILDALVLEHPVPGFLTPEFRERLTADIRRLVDFLRERRLHELREDLYRRIGAYLSREQQAPEADRLPVEIQADTDDRFTVLTVRGTDRKALLFSLSNALSLQGLSIHKLVTRAEGNRFEDRITVTDVWGRPITNPAALDRLKVAIVLMERFTSTLPQASDYAAAVQSFNAFIDAITEKGEKGDRSENGARPEAPQGAPTPAAYEDFTLLSSLARILGAGPYLWEEMLKLPFDEVYRLLSRLDEERKPMAKPALAGRLRVALAGEESAEARWAALNRFKDFQLFRLDAVHLVFPTKTLEEFSSEISDLADIVLGEAMSLAYRELARELGEPRLPAAVGDGTLPCPYGLFAQGKLGGRELGYASDLELQLIYAGSGETHPPEGGEPVSNAIFFNRLVEGLRKGLAARAEGIFELDLRLRPHGEDGPLASHLETWSKYYAQGGGAYDYERQALLKMRPVAAPADFAGEVMAARDALLFGREPVDIAHTLELRARQVETLAGGARSLEPGRINAKFAPGGLVEVEYAVQFLQLAHGRRLPSLRLANTEKALGALLEEGILSPAEFERMFKAYVFLRRLINALRMVRGHARDLVVPARGTEAFLYLAKRMGYRPTPRYEPDSQLDWDLRHALRDVHALFIRRFPGKGAAEGGAATAPLAAEKDGAWDDLSLTAAFLNPSAPAGAADEALAALGMRKGGKGPELVREMLGLVREKGLLCAVLVLAEAKLRASPDPESVIMRLGQYLEAVGDPDYSVRQLLDHPRMLDMLIKVFGHSEYLTHILVRQPDYLLQLAEPGALEKAKIPEEFRREILELLPSGASLDAPSAEAAGREGLALDPLLESLRRYRNREYLRIGLRDIFLGEPMQRLTAEISQLTNALVDAVFGMTLGAADAQEQRDAICVLALGKLGGMELNYSSDIDVVFVFDPARTDSAAMEALERWAQSFLKALSAPGAHGKMFRVDAQLRPYGGQGNLVATVSHYLDYYRDAADGWELQSWLKARPLAGNLGIGRDLARRIQAMAVAPENREKILDSMRKVRLMGLEKLKVEHRLSSEVKLGPGGIRTIEFYVQYLQILHGAGLPELITGNTLAALAKLWRFRLITSSSYELLTRSYVFLRRIEHALQLQGMQQRHNLPESPEELEKLARRMGFEERLGRSASDQFREKYRKHMLTLQDLSSTLFGYETNRPDGAGVQGGAS
jgi:glutamate-ammonia-ligase adenylyltransferase